MLAQMEHLAEAEERQAVGEVGGGGEFVEGLAHEAAEFVALAGAGAAAGAVLPVGAAVEQADFVGPAAQLGEEGA